jgi:hypothetical protein
MNESGPSALYRQHHDVEAPRVDHRHFRPAWWVLTRLDRLLSDHVITSAEWHAAADYRELVDQVRRGGLSGSALVATRAARSGGTHWVAGDLDASGRLRRIRAVLGCLGLARCSRRRWCGIYPGQRSAGIIAAIRKPRALG